MARPLARSLVFSAALTLLLVLPSCLFGSSSKTTQHGTRIGQETYDQVVPGKKQDFVLALCGDPTSKSTVEGGEIWKWSYRKETTSSGGVIFIISSKTKTEIKDAVFVEFRGDAVHKVWRDG